MHCGIRLQKYAGLIPLFLFQFAGLFLAIQLLPLFYKLFFLYNRYNKGPFLVQNLYYKFFPIFFLCPFIFTTLYKHGIKFPGFLIFQTFVANYFYIAANRIRIKKKQ